MNRCRLYGRLHALLTSTGGGQLHAPAALPQRQKNLVVHWIDYSSAITYYLKAIGCPLDKTRPNKEQKYSL